MFFDDHSPPHFHAYYGGNEGSFEIHTLAMTAGDLPGRVHAMVLEWASLHRQELMAAWEAAKAKKPPNKIAPLA